MNEEKIKIEELFKDENQHLDQETQDLTAKQDRLKELLVKIDQNKETDEGKDEDERREFDKLVKIEKEIVKIEADIKSQMQNLN